MSARLVQGIWFAAILAVALVAIGIGLDREARRGDFPTRLVPPPFRFFAEERIAAHAVKAGDPAAALASARRLVMRRPVPAENLMLLGLAELRAGEPERGTWAIQMAARRGWRDVGAQKVMFGLAIEAGDHDEAANRVAALWIAPGADEEALADTKALLASEPGRQALGRRLAGGGYWIRGLLRQAGHFEPEALSRAFAVAHEGGAEFDCRTIARIAARYAKSGREEASRRVWGGQCAESHALADMM